VAKDAPEADVVARHARRRTSHGTSTAPRRPVIYVKERLVNFVVG
jgi:hypothetical protein